MVKVFKILHVHYMDWSQTNLKHTTTLFKDYVTEKYFQMLNLNIAPVVRGDGNYSVVGSPNSFINTKDFPTVEKLANYFFFIWIKMMMNISSTWNINSIIYLTI